MYYRTFYDLVIECSSGLSSLRVFIAAILLPPGYNLMIHIQLTTVSLLADLADMTWKHCDIALMSGYKSLYTGI